VRAAAELDVGHRWPATDRIGRDVMKLEEAVLATAPAILCHKRAATTVAKPDGALDFSRDVSRTGETVAALARAVGRYQFPLSQIL